jgi:predicted enzyme related to lactoylglutathione lyase
MSRYPRTFSHTGISVPDLEQAAEFYSEVMGCYHIMEPTTITEESNTPIGQMCTDVFGKTIAECVTQALISPERYLIAGVQLKPDLMCS